MSTFGCIVVRCPRWSRMPCSLTPRRIDGGSIASTALRKVFFLEHGSRNALVSDRPMTLYALLFQQLFLPFWDGEALAFAANFAHELITSLPAHRPSVDTSNPAKRGRRK